MGVLLSWAWRTVDNSSVTVFAWHFLVHSSTTPATATTAKKDKQICGDQLSEMQKAVNLVNQLVLFFPKSVLIPGQKGVVTVRGPGFNILT